MRTQIIKQCLPTIVFLVVFIGISFQYINAPLKTMRSEYGSTDLKKIVTKDENVTRTDYIDDDGNLQIAANAGYATKIVVRKNNSEIETFFDDHGERISMYCRYYGIMREYDTKGNTIRITYLDEKNAPIVMSEGYAVEEREFNETGQQVSCRYLDTEGNPALSDENGFGMRYEYDDKGCRIRTTYLGKNGEPMVLSAGYSTLVREYYKTDGPENGKVKKEFYFLSDGTPALLSMGQYGVYKEYYENGQISFITYLDADESPMVTKKGYTSVT